MRSKNKIKAFFEKNGYQRNWYANKLGMNKNLFWSITNGNIPIPIKHWEIVVNNFGGFVTYHDLLYDFLEYELSKTKIAKLKETNKKSELVVVVGNP